MTATTPALSRVSFSLWRDTSTLWSLVPKLCIQMPFGLWLILNPNRNPNAVEKGATTNRWTNVCICSFTRVPVRIDIGALIDIFICCSTCWDCLDLPKSGIELRKSFSWSTGGLESLAIALERFLTASWVWLQRLVANGHSQQSCLWHLKKEADSRADSNSLFNTLYLELWRIHPLQVTGEAWFQSKDTRGALSKDTFLEDCDDKQELANVATVQKVCGLLNFQTDCLIASKLGTKFTSWFENLESCRPAEEDTSLECRRLESIEKDALEQVKCLFVLPFFGIVEEAHLLCSSFGDTE